MSLTIVAMAMFALVAFKKPQHAAGLLLALLPTYLIRYNINTIPTTFLELMIVVFLIVIFATHYKKLGSFKKLNRINWITGLFLLSGVVGVLASPEPSKALGIFKAFIFEPVLLFYAFLLFIKKEADLKLPLSYLAISGTVISTFGIIQYFTNIGLPMRFWGSGEEVRRIVSVFEYPNALALYLAPLFGFFFILYAKGKINDSLVLSFLITSGIAIYLTFSRGAWLSVIFAVLIYFASKYGIKKLLPYLAIAVFLILLITPVRERLLLIYNDPSSEAHLGLMKVGVEKVAENPLLGNGLYGFRNTLETSGFTGEILNYPHNIFLNFWLELGLLGLLALGFLYRQGMYEAKNKPSILKMAAAFYLIIFLIHGMVDVPYFKNDLSILFWFIYSLFYIPE